MDLVHWARGLPAVEGEDRPGLTYRELWLSAAELPGAVPRVIGHSVRGEPIWSLTIEATPRERAAATVLVIAGLHAMEHVGPRTALALCRRAAAGEAGWRDRRLVVVPLVNPDGWLDVERMLAAGGRRFLRKNANGVDLNRNFATGWDGRYYLNRLLPRLFAAGSGPLSEPETQAVDALAGSIRPDYAVSLHAFGEWIFVPYAGRRAAPPDLPRLLELAGQMAARQPTRRYRVMQLAARSRLFAARGAEIDHLYERHGALSFLIEIGAGPSFSEPEHWMHPYRWFTPDESRLGSEISNVLPAIDVLSDAPPWQRTK